MKNPEMMFVLAGAVALGGLFLWFRPAPEPAPQSPPAAPATVAGAETPQTSPPAVPVRSFELAVSAGRRVSGPNVLAVTQGDVVRIGIVSDVAEDLHLHGYDLKLDLKPGVHAELTFRADRSGRFEYELEQSRLELGVLEVQPK